MKENKLDFKSQIGGLRVDGTLWVEGTEQECDSCDHRNWMEGEDQLLSNSELLALIAAATEALRIRGEG